MREIKRAVVTYERDAFSLNTTLYGKSWIEAHELAPWKREE